MLRILIALTVLLAPATVRAACTSPAGTESQTRYDFSLHRLFYCDGTNWIKVEPAPAKFFYCTNAQSDADGTGDVAGCVAAANNSNGSGGVARYRTISCERSGYWVAGGVAPAWRGNIISGFQWQGWASDWFNCADGTVLVIDTQP